MKDKKRIFSDYVDEFTTKLEQNKRENRKRQKEEYYELLDQISEITVNSKYFQ